MLSEALSSDRQHTVSNTGLLITQLNNPTLIKFNYYFKLKMNYEAQIKYR